MKLFRGLFVLGVITFFGIGCSSSKKKTIDLNELEGKKVALVEVEGEETARKVIEVALINQLVQKGTFILVSKKDIEAIKKAPEQDPRDWKGIARKAKADYALRAKTLKFDATTHEGYSSEEVEDSQLAAETGNGKTTEVYKSQSLDGDVEIELEFTRLADNFSDSKVVTAQDRVVQTAKNSAIHLPPKLRFLEGLCNQAFQKFFKDY